MARVHGTAGAYARSEAHRRFVRMLAWLLGTLFVLGVALGCELASWNIAAVGAVILVALFGGLRIKSRVERHLDALQKERLQYLRGGLGEELVGSILKELSDEWHVFHGVQVNSHQDLDHVVVGPGGLFYIQTKNVRGLVSCAANGQPLHNGRPTPFVQQALGQAMDLKARLATLIGPEVPWMNTILAVPFAYVQGHGQIGWVRVLHQDNLLQFLKSKRERLSSEEVERCANAIAMLTDASPPRGGITSMDSRPAPRLAA